MNDSSQTPSEENEGGGDQPPRHHEPVAPAPTLRSQRVLHGTLKLVALGVLIVVLWIPLAMVQGLVKQRSGMERRVAQEIGSSWGGEQSMVGPVVTGHYQCVDPDLARPRCSRGQHLLRHSGPVESAWSGALTPQVRSRGIYETVVWRSELEATARFRPLPVTLSREGYTFELRKVIVAVGLTDPVGLDDRAEVRVLEDVGILSTAVGSALPEHALTAEFGVDPWTGSGDVTVELDLNLRGTRRLSFVPLTGSTTAELASSWSSPSFSGARLPVEREVSEDGFRARWQAAQITSRIPAVWWDQEPAIRTAMASRFGVDLLKPVDGYRLTTRATKYGLLFVLLTFATFFLLEVTAGHRLHPVQYLLAGAALCVFYLLLLSLTEHVGFALAYLVSAAATVSLVTLYAWGIARRRSWGIALFACLSGLYGYLYVVLQLEDFALLMGSLGLFVVLSLIMWVTRRFDWFTFEFSSELSSADLVAPGGD